MLDPKEQQKGGFGAFAARQRERLGSSDATGDVASNAATDAASDATSDASAVPPEAPVNGAEPPPRAAAASEPAEPHRQRFFRSIL